MKKPMIGIIIPIYNTQDYIIECLESVRKQTYTDYEAIIVNDGSTDESERLISEFISDNHLDNFHLVCKENGGLCSARNKGLKCAKGEWVVFLDSDDWIEPTLFANLITAQLKHYADFVLAGFRVYYVDTGTFDTWSNYTAEYGGMPQDLKDLRSLDYVCCGRMYKRSIIDEHSLRFDERIKFCEDNAFNFDYVSVIKSYACVDEIGYTYRRGHPGAMSNWSVAPHMRKYIREHMRGFCDKMPEEHIIDALKENRSFSHIMWNALFTDVVVDILENKTAEAKAKMKQPLALEIVDSFVSNNKKDKVLRYLWNKPFFLFKIFVNAFYKNIDKIKKNKWLARFLTH